MHPDKVAFRSLVEQSGDTILLLDPAGTVAYANSAAEQLFGRPLANLIGEDFGGIATSEKQSDIYIPHPQRGNVATNARSTTIRLDDIPYTAVYLRDISERAQAEERLRQYSVALDAIDQGLMIIRQDTIIVAVNPAFTTITGYTQEEVLGRTTELLRTGSRRMKRVIRR